MAKALSPSVQFPYGMIGPAFRLAPFPTLRRMVNVTATPPSKSSSPTWTVTSWTQRPRCSGGGRQRPRRRERTGRRGMAYSAPLFMSSTARFWSGTSHDFTQCLVSIHTSNCTSNLSAWYASLRQMGLGVGLLLL